MGNYQKKFTFFKETKYRRLKGGVPIGATSIKDHGLLKRKNCY
jgi:hypothetical protein